MKLVYPPGATPLDPDEAEELIPIHITTQAELNEWEENNILSALAWVSNQKHNLLNEKGCLTLHKKMFDQTWAWAGKFRKTNKKIGVDKFVIAIELKKLFVDIQYQLDHQSFKLDEIAARFHHRLVAIHPFPNGNGRHARIAADHLLCINNSKPFSWGGNNLVNPNDTRKKYIDALRKADKMNYVELLKFVRS